MCTLIALHQVQKEFPLIVAANRDESYARASSGPTVLHDSPLVVGGRDEEKGGTWLGFSERGYFVGITNQRSWDPPDAALRSRGEVVLGALRQESVDASLRWLGAIDGRSYNSFNLLVGDARQLHVVYARREDRALEVAALAPGIWALPNDRLGSPEFPKIDRAVELARPLCELSWQALVPRAQAMLADHVEPDLTRVPPGPAWLPENIRGRLQALCVHTESYGTRSATLLAISQRGVEHYLHADGPPCQNKLQDRDDLL